jgi:lysophospholipase L1-like esterase
MFRAVAAGVPLAVGGVLLAWVLFQQGWLSRDPQSGRIRVQRPPLYLQEPGYEVTGHRYLYDATLGWRNIPGWRATTRGRPLSINAQGFRGTEDVDDAKSRGVRRILILGDSYAWGYGVADHEVFAVLLERLLNEVGNRYEVINTGVSGWGTDQQLLFLRQEGFRYDPDVVVVAFFLGNDIDNNSAASQYGLHKPVFVDYAPRVANVPVPRPGQPVDSRLQRRVAHLDPVRLTVAILHGIQQACRRHGCRLVLMKFGRFLAPDLPYAIELERNFVRALTAAQLELAYLDLDEEFRRRDLDARALLEGNDDGHWNAYGHRQVAEILREYLERGDE